MNETRKEIEARQRAKLRWMAAVASGDKELAEELPDNSFMINTCRIILAFDSWAGNCNALLTQGTCSDPLSASELATTVAESISAYDRSTELSAEGEKQFADILSRPARYIPEIAALFARKG
jgi:hypothetical protein